jgi:hypothetical protein
MVTDRDARTAVPEQWLAVLDAVADACAAEHASSASTRRISVRIRGVNARTARMLLRLLRRRGYLDVVGEYGDGAPLRWALTPAGRSLRDSVRVHLGTTTPPGCPVPVVTGPVVGDNVVQLAQALHQPAAKATSSTLT